MTAGDAEKKNGGEEPPSPPPSPFLPSATWQGPKPGYYFGTSGGRTGYYGDHQGQSSAAAEAAKKKKTKRTRVQIAEDRNETRFIPRNEERPVGTAARQEDAAPGASEEALKLLAEAEQQAGGHLTVDLSARGVARAAAALRKAVAANEMQRIRHPDDPAKYMDSEVALFEHVRSLKALAADPAATYGAVAASSDAPLLGTLLPLLAHDNPDVAVAAVSLLLEWLDPSLLELEGEGEGDPAAASAVADALAGLASAVVGSDSACELLVANLARLPGGGSRGRKTDDDAEIDEEEEEVEDEVGRGAEDVLALFENLLDLEAVMQAGDPSRSLVPASKDGTGTAVTVAAKLASPATGLVSWLFQQASGSGGLRYRAVEMLALLAPREEVYAVLSDWSQLTAYSSVFSSEDGNRKPAAKEDGSKSTKVDGIETLLQTVAAYRKKQPETEEEVELLENACIVLASVLTYSPPSAKAFLEAQGIELVVRCLKERVYAGGVALKWLDFSGSDPVYKSACEHLVEAGALKYLCPLLMGKNLPKSLEQSSKKKGKAKRSWKQSIEETTVRILYSLVRHLRDDSPNDAKQRLLAKFTDESKCDRLVELLLTYDQRARLGEYKFYRDNEEEVEEEALQLAALEAKLDAGGDLFHRLAAIIAFCCVGSRKCHERILSRLREKDSGMGLVKESLEEFVSVLGESDQKEQLQSYLEQL
jgi:beta-catenin-like protein 1